MSRQSGVGIGRLGGVAIVVDRSWFLIAALVWFSFYAELATVFPGTPPVATVVASGATTLAFFTGVLLHELAHAWMASARGFRVDGITLFIFGGATSADLESGDPSDEMAISVVGPLTSLAVAGAMWAAATAAGAGLLGYCTGRLGWINLALAVFNLVPGFPLDGGRLLRAWLWRSSGDLVGATRTAARAGRWTGQVLMALGVIEFLLGGAVVGGIWLVAIGWFLARSADAAYADLTVRRMLAGVRSGELAEPAAAVPPGLTLAEVVDRHFVESDQDAFLVADPPSPLRVITLSCLQRFPRAAWESTRVDDAAEDVTPSHRVAASESMDRLVDLLRDKGWLVVMEEGSVKGIITVGDVSRRIQRSRDLGITEPVR